MSDRITLGEVAAHCEVPIWQVRRLYERGILPPADRIGQYRVIDRADLPKIRDALVQAGYLPNGAAGGAR